MTIDAPDKPRWTPSQLQALDQFDRFVTGLDLRMTLVLRGAAGTGKSTLARELVSRARSRGNMCVLVAPTGRAARVLKERTDYDTSTIHSYIYNLHEVVEQVDESEQPIFRFELKNGDEPANTVFFVDEASMVGDEEIHDTNLRFGSGRLLADLVKFVFWAHPDPRRKLVFIGDHCQLPPVHAESSRALDAAYLREKHRLVVSECTLQEIVRQHADSVLVAATARLRKAIEDQQYHTLHWDVGDGLRVYDDTGPFSQAIRDRFSSGQSPHLICYKNATVREWNKWVRETLLQRGDDPEVGDRLIVLRNHAQSGLMNGDFVDVATVGDSRQRTVRGVTLNYRQATIRFIAPEGERDWSGLMLENALLSRERQLTEEEEQARWILFKMDHPKLQPGTPEFKEALLNDRFWNCLIPKYGYATTCHKAQGGEWDEVFVGCDFGPQQGLRNPTTFRWLYTATTRARQSLCLLNPPTWTAADVLAAPPPNPGPADSPDGLGSVEDQIEMVVTEAATAAGLQPPTFKRLQYMVRAEWPGDSATRRAEVRYKGDGSISGLLWTGDARDQPTFELPELESRWWAKHPLAPTDTCPDGVRETLDRLAAIAPEHGLGVNWVPQQFAVLIVSFDPAAPAMGVARIRASYDGAGRFTSKQIMRGDATLIKRLNRVLQALG